jgi:hypothetical protein
MTLDTQPSDYRLVLRTTNEDETAALLLTLHKTISAGAIVAHAVISKSMPKKTQSDVFVRHMCCTHGSVTCFFSVR